MFIPIEKSSPEFQRGFKTCMKLIKEYCKDHPKERLSYLGGLLAHAELLQEYSEREEFANAKDN